MSGVHVVEMAVAQVVGVAVVLHRGVAAAGAVPVVVVRMGRVLLHPYLRMAGEREGLARRKVRASGVLRSRYRSPT